MWVGFNGYIQYRLLSKRPVTWHWLVALYALDVFLISVVAVLSSGFSHEFLDLFYYPALVGMAVLLTSFRLNMAWVTIVSLVYVVISLTVEDGIAIDVRDEKALLARIVVTYAVVAASCHRRIQQLLPVMLHSRPDRPYAGEPQSAGGPGCPNSSELPIISTVP